MGQKLWQMFLMETDDNADHQLLLIMEGITGILDKFEFWLETEGHLKIKKHETREQIIEDDNDKFAEILDDYLPTVCGEIERKTREYYDDADE